MAAEEKSTEPEPSLVDSLTDLPQQATGGRPSIPSTSARDCRSTLSPTLCLGRRRRAAAAELRPRAADGLAPVRENEDESLPKSYEDAVAMTEFVCEFVDLLTKRGLRVRHSVARRASCGCRVLVGTVSFAGQSFALADACEERFFGQNDFVFVVGDREYAF